MPTKVTLRTTDVSPFVVQGSLSYGPLDLGNRIGTASFRLRTAAPFRPEDEDYCEITDTDGVTRLFSGLVRMPKQTDILQSELALDVAAQGWGAMLKRILITATEAYAAGKSDSEIVADLLAKYYGPIATSVAHVLYAANTDMPALTFVAGTTALFDALETISRAAYNASWSIDADKKVRWNDVNRHAPYALSSSPDGTYTKGHRDCSVFRDATQHAARVRVIGTGGVEYTATDWVKFGRLNLRNSDQPGTPTSGFYQLPDITDTTLTTVAQCKQRAWAELVAVETRTVLTTLAYSTGIVPGMRLDVVDTTIGTRTTPHLQPRAHQVCMTEAKQLYKGMGRFTVQRVTPKALSLDKWEVLIEAGAYEPDLNTALARL